jgi:hypothetical protein
MTLVLAFIAVWSRAMGMLQSRHHAAQDASRLISAPSWDMQEQFWMAIQQGNEHAFYTYLLLSSQMSDVFQGNCSTHPASSNALIWNNFLAVSENGANPSS